MITIADLVFRYPNMQIPCLDIPAFHVNAGERVFLYGPSGSGKSTLLGLLSGVLTAETGTVQLLDHDFSQITQTQRDCERANHIGYIFQQFNLIPYLSVIENVCLPCKFSQLRLTKALANGGALQSEAERLLSQLDLNSSLWSQQVTQLSVGQQQRVAAARALIGQPEIIIADEPTSALDADRQAIFLELLLRESAEAGSTLLVVSHDRRLASAFHREVDLTSINRAVALDSLVSAA
jgi:putative ABC transport system ATP-binding protein